jgi:hypothetical protein
VSVLPAYVPAFAADIKIKMSLPPGDVPFNVWSPLGAQAAYKLSTAPRPATGVAYKPPNAHSWTPPQPRAQGRPTPSKGAAVEVRGPEQWSHAEQRHQWARRVRAEDREAALAELQFAARDAATAATAGMAFGCGRSSSVRGSAPGVGADLALPSPAAALEQQLAFRAATARLLSGEAAACTRAARGSFGGSSGGSGRASDGSVTVPTFQASEAEATAAAGALLAASGATPAQLSALALAPTAPRLATTTVLLSERDRNNARCGTAHTSSAATAKNASSSSSARSGFTPSSASLALRGLTPAQAASLLVAPLLGARHDSRSRRLVNQTKRLLDVPGNRPSRDSAAMRLVLSPGHGLQGDGPLPLPLPAPLPAHLAPLRSQVARRRLQQTDAAADNSALACAVAARQAATARDERAWADASVGARAGPFSAAHAGAVSTVGVLSRMTLTSEQINERPAGSVRKMWF